MSEFCGKRQKRLGEERKARERREAIEDRKAIEAVDRADAHWRKMNSGRAAERRVVNGPWPEKKAV